MCSASSIKIPLVTYIRAIIAFSSSIRRRPIRTEYIYIYRESEREKKRKKTVRKGSIFTVLFDPATYTHTHAHTRIYILESRFPPTSCASEYTNWFTAAQCDVLLPTLDAFPQEPPLPRAWFTTLVWRHSGFPDVTSSYR